MEDDDYIKNQYDIYAKEFLKTTAETTPRIFETMHYRNRQKAIEVLIDNMIDNLFTYGKIRLLLGKDAQRFTEEELDNVKRNLLSLIK